MRVAACLDNKLSVSLISQSYDGFYLCDAPTGVYIERYAIVPSTGFQHSYEIHVPTPGTFELMFMDHGEGDPVWVTVQVFSHEYEDGECKNCGKLDPTVHHHQWENATCLEPKTCATCGATEGEPRGHNWVEASCTEPRHCSLCALTEGEPLGHDVLVWSCTEPGICRRCNSYQEHDAGHGADEECGLCGKFRLIGCVGEKVTFSIISELDTPFTLAEGDTAVSVTLDSCVPETGKFLHTYSIVASEEGNYEISMIQEGGASVYTFFVHLTRHRYENGKCESCGKQITGTSGDVDGDTQVTYLDAMTALQAAVGLVSLSSEEKSLADVDGDGEVTYLDAMSILQYAVGLITQWGNGA